MKTTSTERTGHQTSTRSTCTPDMYIKTAKRAAPNLLVFREKIKNLFSRWWVGLFFCFKNCCSKTVGFLVCHEMHTGLLVRYMTIAGKAMFVYQFQAWISTTDQDYGSDYGECFTFACQLNCPEIRTLGSTKWTPKIVPRVSRLELFHCILRAQHTTNTRGCP